MDYRAKILEWFDTQSQPKMSSGAYGVLQKKLKQLELLYPLQAVYFSLKDVETKHMKWIEKQEFGTPFAFMGYVWKVAEQYFIDNAKKVEKDNKENNTVEFDVDIYETREVKRVVKDISEFL